MVFRDGRSLHQAKGHGFALITDGREALIREMNRSESAMWMMNGCAVAWMCWCLRQEMAGLPAHNLASPPSK